jgi:hypothetical protein
MAGGNSAGAPFPVGIGGEEAGSLGGFAEVGGLWGDDFVVPGESAIVEALAEEDYVCYCVVDCENYLLIINIFPCGVEVGQTIVGNTPCSTAPRMLKTSPASQTMINCNDNPSAEPLLKFSII